MFQRQTERPSRSSSVKSRSQSVAAIVAIDELWSRRPCDMKPEGVAAITPRRAALSPEDTSTLYSTAAGRRNYVCNRRERAHNCRGKNDEFR